MDTSDPFSIFVLVIWSFGEISLKVDLEFREFKDSLDLGDKIEAVFLWKQKQPLWPRENTLS